MGFDNWEQFFQAITIMGIVDEDLGSIILSQDFHSARNARLSNPFLDILKTRS